jgi:serralysin
VSGGYRVAWSSGSQWSVWTADSNANFQSSMAAMSAGDPTLRSYETTFQHDLNGDGTIGVKTTVIESAGATSLVQVTNNYFFYPHGGSSGPEMTYGGAPLTEGQFAGWTPLAVEFIQSASQYSLAWKSGSQIKFMNTDSNGKYLAETTPISTSDPQIGGYENFFQQDLNGNGLVGSVVASNAKDQLSGGHSTSDALGSATWPFPNPWRRCCRCRHPTRSVPQRLSS